MKSRKRWQGATAVAMAVTLAAMAVATVQAAPNPKKGRRTYNQYCVPCHGKAGDGNGTRATVENLDPKPRNHTDGKYMNQRTNVQLFKVDREGGKANNFSHIMPQWKHILKDDEIWDVIAYIRSLAVPKYQEPTGGNGQ